MTRSRHSETRHSEIRLAASPPDGTFYPRRNRAGRRLACAWLAVLVSLPLWIGCTGGHSTARRGPQASADSGGELIKALAENINHMEEFDIRQMQMQVRDQLNQWVQSERPSVDWAPEPMLATLAEPLQKLAEVKSLAAEEYSVADVSFLQEAIWLRDIAKTAQKGQFDDLPLAERLFDWTVRNLQLQPDTGPGGTRLPHGPRDLLLSSRSTAEERAWIFTLLARQLGLDVVMLTLPDQGHPRRVWLPALLLEKDLYLFDSRLGLPIPGPGGQGVATLAQAAADDSLLRALDLDAKHPYPVHAADLHDVVPWIEASPGYLSKRMKLVQSQLAGANNVVLSTNADALAGRLQEVPGLTSPVLWPLPYDVVEQRSHLTPELLQALTMEQSVYLFQPQLVAGRARQFKGEFEGPKGAKEVYMQARPSSSKLLEARMPPQQRKVYEDAKQAASFWLGIICYEEGDYPVAIDYFSKRTLEAAPDSPWTAAAQYNLARAYEATGQLDKAIELYEDDDSPQRHGNRLRARSLKTRLAATAASVK